MNDLDKKRVAILLGEQQAAEKKDKTYVLITISKSGYTGSFPLIPAPEFSDSEDFVCEEAEIILTTFQEVFEKYIEDYELIGIDFAPSGPRPVLRKTESV